LEGVESEYEDASTFMVQPHDSIASRAVEDPGASSSGPKARKRAADEDMMQAEEAKRA
jgi:hypothetical protein